MVTARECEVELRVGLVLEIVRPRVNGQLSQRIGSLYPGELATCLFLFGSTDATWVFGNFP